MEFRSRTPSNLTDKVVEKQVPLGGNFNIKRGQYSDTQGPGGFDWVSRETGGTTKSTVIPTTDRPARSNEPDIPVWKRGR